MCNGWTHFIRRTRRLPSTRGRGRRRGPRSRGAASRRGGRGTTCPSGDCSPVSRQLFEFRFWVLGFGFGVLGFLVWGSGFGVWGHGFRVLFFAVPGEQFPDGTDGVPLVHQETAHLFEGSVSDFVFGV